MVCGFQKTEVKQMEKDLYQILGVRQDSDMKAIKTAYRKLAKKYHPDTNQGNPNAEMRFKEVTEAYEILSDEVKREAYNRKIDESNAQPRSQHHNGTKARSTGARAASTGNMKNDLENQFEQFFGYNPKTKEKTAAKKGGKNPMDTSDLFGSFFNMGKK